MAGNGVELVWEGKRTQVERVALPFQRVEIINESRASRQAAPLFATGQLIPDPLFAPLTEHDNWRNKLIWGDNKYVLASLLEGDPGIGLEPLAGKVDLIYIDPPFATGADFSYRTSVGDIEIEKEPSALEEVAYRDTWGHGTESYVQMMYERLSLAKVILAKNGSIYVHCDSRMSSALRLLMDEIFGPDRFRNEIVWKRSDAKGDVAQGSRHYARVHDTILYYTKSDSACWNAEYVPLSQEYTDGFYRYRDPDGRRWKLENMLGPGGAAKGNPVYEVLGVARAWRYSRERMQALVEAGLVVQSKPGRVPMQKKYLDDSKGVSLGTWWDDISMIRGWSGEKTGYNTQKPEALLDRILKVSSNKGDVVADLFLGSGTTAAVAEKLGRKWIGCDLGRFAIHTSRKRLLGIEGCKPFEVLNLGRYERKYWQGINAGEAVYEYLKFIVELYHAEPISGFTHLHGRKDGSMVHVGATDAPVTIAEVRAAMEECAANGLKALDVLGWEWEMGLNSTGLGELQSESGVETRLFHIPHEIMDKRAVAAGDVHFYEAAYVKAELHVEKREVSVRLVDFLVAVDDYVHEKVGDKVKKFSDWIDYWAVDYEYNGDIFHNQWQAYRTRKEPKLELASRPHVYTESGKRNVLVKVVDIFGNDTTALLEVTV